MKIKSNKTMEEILDFLKNKFFTTLSYNELKNWVVGEAVIKEAISHWEPLGFLDGLNSNKKEELAIAFDNVAHDIIYEADDITRLIKRYNFNCYLPDNFSEKVEDEVTVFDLTNSIFPVLRRVICGASNTDSNGIDNFDYKKFVEYLDELSFLAINYDEYPFKNVDIEAEFIAVLSNAIISLFKNLKKR